MKLQIITDKYGDKYWYCPIGTWVRAIIYEDVEFVGQISRIDYDQDDDLYYYQISGTGFKDVAPWGSHYVYPLSKLERALL